MKKFFAPLASLWKIFYLIFHWIFIKPTAWILGHRKEAVIVHSYAPFIFCWPLIVMGFLFPLLLSHGWLAPVMAGRIYAVVLCYVLLTIGVDINRNQIIFFITTAFCLFFGIILLQERGFTWFGQIGRYLVNLRPELNPHLILLVAFIVTILYAIIIGDSWLNERWKFIPGEIEHWSFGRSDDSMGRGAKVISTSYPDILELILFLSGTITIYNAQKTMVIARITRVPLLPFRARRITEFLNTVFVTPSEEETGVEDHTDHESEEHSGLTS